jgi:transposase InsO family protein
MAKGFVYLVVIMDWASRAVLAWRLSNTLGADFCVEVLEEALARHGRPEIFNTDQGSQFTSEDFTGTLKDYGVMISMDGKGRCMDNIFTSDNKMRRFRPEKTPKPSLAALVALGSISPPSHVRVGE